MGFHNRGNRVGLRSCLSRDHPKRCFPGTVVGCRQRPFVIDSGTPARCSRRWSLGDGDRKIGQDEPIFRGAFEPSPSSSRMRTFGGNVQCPPERKVPDQSPTRCTFTEGSGMRSFQPRRTRSTLEIQPPGPLRGSRGGPPRSARLARVLCVVCCFPPAVSGSPGARSPVGRDPWHCCCVPGVGSVRCAHAPSITLHGRSVHSTLPPTVPGLRPGSPAGPVCLPFKLSVSSRFSTLDRHSVWRPSRNGPPLCV